MRAVKFIIIAAGVLAGASLAGAEINVDPAAYHEQRHSENKTGMTIDAVAYHAQREADKKARLEAATRMPAAVPTPQVAHPAKGSPAAAPKEEPAATETPDTATVNAIIDSVTDETLK